MPNKPKEGDEIRRVPSPDCPHPYFFSVNSALQGLLLFTYKRFFTDTRSLVALWVSFHVDPCRHSPANAALLFALPAFSLNLFFLEDEHFERRIAI